MLTQPGQPKSMQVPLTHCCAPEQARHWFPPAPHPIVLWPAEAMQMPLLLQQPLQEDAQLPPSLLPPPPPPEPPPPPWPKLVQLPNVHTWLSEHAEQAAPLMPHAWLELPG